VSSGAFPSGGLWSRVDAISARARASGALVPLATSVELVRGEELAFAVHVLARITRKEEAGATQRREGRNPFLPPDPRLVVAPVGDEHLAVLNKFNVLDRHLLVVTRAFVDQERPLDRADFDALWRCLAEGEALAFYNSGVVAGASQAHKHLQLVPLPLVDGLPGLPIEPLVGPVLDTDRLAVAPALPFRHAAARLDQPLADPPSRLRETYHTLCVRVGLDRDWRPYNLLVTRRWMLLVPRSAEHFEGISVNALGFAGSLLVRDRTQLERVRDVGLLEILRRVAES
jgi:ATP adenylyltransferase